MRIILWALLVFSAGCTVRAQEESYATPVAATAPPLPTSIVALGDSITAAALAGSVIPSNIFDYGLMAGGLVNHPFRAPGLTILEDDFGAIAPFIENQHLSWSTGWDPLRRVASLKRRAERAGAGTVDWENLAVSGSEAGDVLAKQLPKLQEWAKAKNDGWGPDLTTLLVGPNDVCADRVEDMTSVVAFEANVEAIARGVLGYPNSRLEIIGIPAIDTLQDVAGDKPWLFGKTCRQIWAALKLCPTLTTLPPGPARDAVRDRVRDFNEVLSRVASKRPDRIRFGRTMAGATFADTELAVDCFHPNIQGQNHIAEAAWRDGFWGE